ncbi:hypothetical protein SpAn4DRAFT_4174 [Sporomusa ovata]|uniref:Uncharacterized protein n=1 Tax=Sporomusa ovata TaxID=2378 RepID=A0A0U1L543_9FIRM|nr:hypothetical protein SpAn4DRAFT_4174 [Sporomusa ovata]
MDIVMLLLGILIYRSLFQTFIVEEKGMKIVSQQLKNG